MGTEGGCSLSPTLPAAASASAAPRVSKRGRGGRRAFSFVYTKVTGPLPIPCWLIENTWQSLNTCPTWGQEVMVLQTITPAAADPFF